MYKLIDRIDLTRLYEKYSYLITDEGRKQFVRTTFILSLCAVAVLFIGYSSFKSLSLHTLNELSPIDQSLLEQSQSKELTLSKDIEYVDDTKNHLDTRYNDKATEQNKTDKKLTDNEAVKATEDKIIKVAKTSESAISVMQSKDQADKKSGLAKKTIYMGANTTQVSITFDDGYNQKTVEKVLDVFKKYNIKSTFFIIGRVLDDYSEVWKRAINEGHQICNHTNNHQVLTNMSDSLIQAEIQSWETSAQKVLGVDYVKRMKKEFPYLRLPGGGGAKSNRILSIAQTNGYTVVGWNLETFSSIINPLKATHSQQEISDRIEKHVITKCKNGSIILLHFNQYDTANIEEIIQGIKSRGFDIQPLSQIIK